MHIDDGKTKGFPPSPKNHQKYVPSLTDGKDAAAKFQATLLESTLPVMEKLTII